MADSQKYYYLKLKEDFFEREEIVILESMKDGVFYSNILMKLFLKSLKAEGRLMFNERIPYDSNMLSTITRQPVAVVEKAISIFKELDLIEILDNGAIYMLDIQNFIGRSSSEGDRKREYRQKIAKEKLFLQQGQMSDEHPPEIEIEKEIELDKDIKIDIESEVDIQESATEKSKINIYDHYQQRIGSIDGYQKEKLDGYLVIDKLEPDLIKRAIDRAADNSKRSFGYVNAILKNWAQNGINTIVKQDEEQRNFEDKKAKRVTTKSQSSNIPDWSNPDYQNSTSEAELEHLAKEKEEMLKKLKGGPDGK